MKLRFLLITFCLLGIGIFSNAQTKQAKKTLVKPTIENGADAIPVTVKSTQRKKMQRKPGVVKFTPPVIIKDKVNNQAPANSPK